jgi:glycosyltransferase involved in cell wall biosynthesis
MTTRHDTPLESLDTQQLLALLQQKEEAVESSKTLLTASESALAIHEMRINILELKQDMSRLELATHTAQKENYRAIAEIIRSQEKVIQNIGLLNKVKNFLRPRIGVLYQYDAPRPLVIPKHYKKPTTLKNPPHISVVTPSFNQGSFIERTILSVLGQNYPALEYCIQDNESTDDTVAIIKHYEPHLKRWESKKDSGQSNAINKGFSHCTGEIMAYLNSDDILLPGTLQYIAQYFAKHPTVDVVYGHRILINEQDHEVGRWVLPQHDAQALTWADYVPQETLFWRRSIWNKAGGKIDESFQFAMDWDLLLRFQAAGAHIVRLPRFLGAFRVHQNQKTAKAISKIGEQEMERLRIRSHGYLISHKQVNKNLRKYLIKHVIHHKLYRLGLLWY